MRSQAFSGPGCRACGRLVERLNNPSPTKAMSQFGPAFDRAQRLYDAASPAWEDYDPPELENAYKCLCGSNPRIVEAPFESQRLVCANSRCGRETKAGFGLAFLVADWNHGIREDQ